MLEKTTEINMLYDFYGLLLTEKQKDYTELYYREDYSLAEIADINKVSRQAVYDNIKRTEQLLKTYEEKLQLFAKHMERKLLITELQALAISLDNEMIQTLANKLDNLN